MKEIEIRDKLLDWLLIKFKTSDLLIEKDVRLVIGHDLSKYRTDLLMIQSKSNVIHGFEIKIIKNLTRINSAIWQTDSIYANYKWLVIDRNTDIPISVIKEKGIGLILFNEIESSFRIEVQAKYLDGNLLKYYPVVEEKWTKTIKNGSNNRSKKTN